MNAVWNCKSESILTLLLMCAAAVSQGAAAQPGATTKPASTKPANTKAAATRAAAAKPAPAKAAAAPAAAPAPAPVQSYVLDAAQSSLGFTFEQAGARSQGRFRELHSTLSCRSHQPADCALTVEVTMNSVDTQDKDRDSLLRGALLFDVQRFAVSRFVSQQFTATGVSGTLSLRDRARPLTVPATLRFATEAGHDVAWLSGEFAINRLDFGVGQGEWASTESVANAVTVNFKLRLVAAQ